MRILYITWFDPADRSSGCAVRGGFLYESLRKLGEVKVTVLCPSAEPRADGVSVRYRPEASAWCLGVRKWFYQLPLLGLRSVFPRVLRSRERVLADLGWEGETFDCVVVRYVETFVRVAAWRLAAAAYVDVTDLPSENLRVRADTAMARLKLPLKQLVMRRFERAGVRLASAAWFANDDERALMRMVGRRLPLVNMAFPPKRGYRPFGCQEKLLMIVGALDYPPNVRGVAWFLQTVWKDFNKAHPDFTLAIIGRDLPEETARLWAAMPAVRVLGYVDDLDSWYERAQAVVAPVLDGTGTSVKVIDALLHSRPVFATPCALRGLSQASIDELRIATFSDAAGFVRAFDSLSVQGESARRVRQSAIGCAAAAAFSPAVFFDQVCAAFSRANPSSRIPVVIPVFGREDVFATLDFLRAQPLSADMRFIVIDNGNRPDLSSRLLALESTGVHVISFPENRGGSAAYIAGMDYAMKAYGDSECVWLLDDDARPNANTLPALRDTMRELLKTDPLVASVGSTVMSAREPDRIVECGARFRPLLCHAFSQLGGASLAACGQRTLRVDYAAACSLLVRTEAVRACGFWEDVFIHFDDIEWGLRTTKCGWHNYATTASTVIHPEFDPEKAGPWICYFDARNQYWLASKYGRLHVASIWLKNFVKDLSARVMGYHPERVPYRVLAWRDFRAGLRRNRTEVVKIVGGAK